jgi:hypothetical protein
MHENASLSNDSARVSESFEGDDGTCVGYARNGLHLIANEVSNINGHVDMEFGEDVIITGDRVDLRCNFPIRQSAGYSICLSQLAFDLNKEGLHCLSLSPEVCCRAARSPDMAIAASHI